MNKEQIASNIAEARKRSGLNQSELARRLGIRPQSVQQWEKGTATPKLNRDCSSLRCFIGEFDWPGAYPCCQRRNR